MERHNRHFTAENLVHHSRRIGQIGNCQHGGGMGVVDKGVWQIGVQQDFNRRIRPAGVQHVAAYGVHHVLVRQTVKRAQGQQRFQTHRRHPRRCDLRQIMTAALYMQHLHIIAEQILAYHFAGRIAATMLHQRHISPQQSRGIGLNRQILIGRIRACLCRNLFCFNFVPTVCNHDAPV